MTALVSRIDFHNFGKYYFYKLKKLRACLVTQVIAALLSYPLAAVLFDIVVDFDIKFKAARDAYNDALLRQPSGVGGELYNAYQALSRQYDTLEALAAVGFIIAIAALLTVVLMHFITPLIAYRRLYKKTYADMDYSLPVSSDAMFWGDFLAGFTIVVPPHLISIILGLIAIQPIHNVDPIYFSMGFSQLFDIAPPLMMTGFLGLIMLYCLSILVMGCCGKLVHAIAAPIIVNIALPATHYLLFWLAQCFAAGNWSGMYMWVESIFVTSPLGMVLSSVGALYVVEAGAFETGLGFFTPSGFFPIQQPRYIIPALLVMVLFALAAWLVIRRRRADQVGARAFAVKPAQYAVHGLIALVVGLIAAWQISRNFEHSVGWVEPKELFSDTVNVYSVLLIIAVPVAYILLELAAGEAKRFGRSLARCGVTFAGVVGVTLGVMCCNGFGAFLKAPAAKNVGAVNVWLEKNYTSEYFSTILAERENIELITRLHNTIEKEDTYSNIFVLADRYVSDPPYYRDLIRLELEYYTFDGHRKDCTLDISEETYRQLLNELAVPEAMANNCVSFETDAVEILGTLTRTDKGAFILEQTAKDGLTPDMVREAVRRDCENVTYERMFKCEPGNIAKGLSLRVLREGENRDTARVGSADGNYYSNSEMGSLKVYPWFDNTLALLSEYGIEVDFGFDADRYKSAFIVKSLPMNNDTISYRFYKGFTDSAEYLFGLVGDDSFFTYSMTQGRFMKYDAETGEEIPYTRSEIEVQLEQNYQCVQAAKISLSQAEELYPLCGSVYDMDTDYNSDHYILVLTDLTSEELAAADRNIESSSVSLFIPREYFGKAAELFNAANS